MSRPTKREEIAAFLEERGLPAGLIDSAELQPGTFAEIREAIARRAWLEVSSGELKGVALVNALKLLKGLSEIDGEGADPSATEPLIADVIAGIPGLSVERRDEILRRELARLDLERDRILGVIERAST